MEEFIHFEQEDTDMVDQGTVLEKSAKGKDPIIDTTPLISPKKEKGSPSSELPPAVQKALETIKTDLAEEMRDEIDELRVDLETGFNAAITASEENTRKQMNDMMATLLKAIQDIKKP
ncbi:hypothetical protein QL285_008888 [Trifolium repens]|nr:hypothetical protein QL285_008888 [Trifolium repens]